MASTMPICWVSRSTVSPFATLSCGLWSVSTSHSWPSSMPVITISSIGDPPSLQSEWRWQSPRSAA